MNPGTILVVDESFSAWKGAEFKHRIDGMPHVTKIKQKPEGVGLELKTLVDGDTNIMLKMELMEGSEAESLKKYRDTYPEHIAVTLRLVEHYAGKAHTIIGDSWFASVALEGALRDKGFNFLGLVKQNSSLFPKTYLKNWFDGKYTDKVPVRGDSILLAANIGGDRKIYALGYKSYKPKMIVSNRGANVLVEDKIITRHKTIERNGKFETSERTYNIKQPQMVKLLFERFGAVDSHNQLRQGILELEREWLTHHWFQRVFATMFGIIVTDAYYAYKYDNPSPNPIGDEPLHFSKFIDVLAYELIHNVMLDKPRGSHHLDTKPLPLNPHVSLLILFKLLYLHSLIFFNYIQQHHFQGRLSQCSIFEDRESKTKQLTCKICKRLTSFYCLQCSIITDDAKSSNIYVVCDQTDANKECWSNHIKHVEA